jgi:mRNA export factor
MFSKQRLKPFPRANNAITAAAFNFDQTNVVFAYAVGYDWSKGAEFHNPAYKSHILLHQTPISEITPRDKGVAGRR